MSQATISSSGDNRTNLYNKMIEAARTYGNQFEIIEDIKGKVTYRQLIMASIALSIQFERILRNEEVVGLLLPNAIGHVVALFALFRLGKTPSILNFSVGAQTFSDCLETAKVSTLITSTEFIEKGNLSHLIDAAEAKGVRILYLESIKEQIGLAAKIKTIVQFLLHKYTDKKGNDVILFTSGSEAKPKGVVLTHENLFRNIEQASSMIDFSSKDKFFNFLPMFHCFGLNVGTFLPVIRGVNVYMYPSPLHYRIIPELICDKKATILFGTSTFLAGYAKAANPGDFDSVRYVFAGAEELKPELQNLWMNKFESKIMQGYGMTEASPILALNTPTEYKEGSVGKFVPDIEYRIKPVAGFDKGGELLVKGPNVMKGYLIHGKGFIPLVDWYATGDLVEIDDEGFIFLIDRIKRFAKVGGEMVSLRLVENIAKKSFPDATLAAIRVPDSRKGERIMLFTSERSVSLDGIRAFIKQAGFSQLLLPAQVQVIEQMPLLATGKIDYVSLHNLADA
jgi:acyl-[acyl-carrier-protein]-phospholipid O-acyltransferase / long-chain-fatty-acid--[acyl-carrier-protein] ligase